MIIKQSSVNKIETTTNGFVQVRFELYEIENGVKISSKYHRATFPPGVDISRSIDIINLSLSGCSYTCISNTDVDLITNNCNLAWTQDKISAYQTSLMNY